MASTSGYVVKVSGKRAASEAEETLYIDLSRLILATDSKQDFSILLEGGERVTLTGADADWVREILDDLAQPRKSQRGSVLRGSSQG
jgi:phosphoserine phosphatase